MRPGGRWVGIILVVLALVVPVAVLGGARMMGLGGFGLEPGKSGAGVMGGFNPRGWTVALVSWALLVGVIGLFVIRLGPGTARTSITTLVGASARDIESRDAKSEITKEQFSEMQKARVVEALDAGKQAVSKRTDELMHRS